VPTDPPTEPDAADARPAPLPAATVVLLRASPHGAEILLTRRPPTMAFAADLDVFPGGRVDAADGDARLKARSTRSPAEAAAILGSNVAPGEALAIHMAAIRELLEEEGILLAEGDITPGVIAAARERLLAGSDLADAFGPGAGPIRLATDRLVPIAQWTTPTFMTRRFATWFFAADLPAGAEPSFQADEIVGHRWIRPEDALAELAAGATTMWVPTASVVEQIVASGASTAVELAAAVRFARVEPARIESETALGVRIALGAAGAVPGRRGRALLLGREVHVLVDPGDPSEDAIDTILAAAERRGGRIAAIVLTATDPDHAAGAEAVAIPLGIPILVAPGAGRHLPYDTRELGDGEPLPADARLRVRLGPPGSGRLEVTGD
jgi:8-oxo-dGTP pyrophosphatase MutT (NUDIX family)